MLQSGLLGPHLGRFKDRLGLDLLELGLEVLGTLGMRGAVGAAARIGHGVVCSVLDFVSRTAPVMDYSQQLRLTTM